MNDMTQLHLAAKNGDENTVRILLNNKADVDVQDLDDMTPLHFAAKYGHENIVRILLENKADVEMKNVYSNGRGEGWYEN